LLFLVVDVVVGEFDSENINCFSHW